MISNSDGNPPRSIAAIILGVLLCMEFGCSSSRLTNTWMDPSFRDQPMTNILVVAVKKNPVSRRIWEDGLVAELSAHGVASTPSYRLFPEAVPDTQQVVGAVQERRCDGVLVVRRLASETAAYDRPGYVRSIPVSRYDRLTQTYHTIYREVYEPGYSDTLKIMRHDINLWSTKEGGQLVWAGTGETLDPSSREEVRSEITGLIIPELVRQGIIATK
jgi:hypothetical protein